jgi:hypothetical protein
VLPSRVALDTGRTRRLQPCAHLGNDAIPQAAPAQHRRCYWVGCAWIVGTTAWSEQGSIGVPGPGRLRVLPRQQKLRADPLLRNKCDVLLRNYHYILSWERPLAPYIAMYVCDAPNSTTLECGWRPLPRDPRGVASVEAMGHGASVLEEGESYPELIDEATCRKYAGSIFDPLYFKELCEM